MTVSVRLLTLCGGVVQATLLPLMDSLLHASLVNAPVEGVYRAGEHPLSGPAMRERQAAAGCGVRTTPKRPRGPYPAAATGVVVVDQHTLAERAHCIKVGEGGLA